MFQINALEPTRQLLLSRHSEEYYMSAYLGVPITKDLFCSTLRVDHRPTCSFFRTRNGVLKMKDFQTGFLGDFIDVVMFKRKVSYYEAIKIIANDFDIIPDKKLEKTTDVITNFAEDKTTVVEKNSPAKIQITIGEWSDRDLNWWKQFGITLDTLKYFNVFRADYVFLNDNIISVYSEHDPSYAYYFGIKDGRELWKIYYPFRKKNRFLLNCSVLQGIQQLPFNDSILVITKSLKDVMSLHELGISAIAPQAESIIMDDTVMAILRLRFKYIVFNGDWDNAGKQFMIKNRKLYGGLCLTFKNKVQDGKDVSDFIKLHGIDNAKKLLMALKIKCNLV